MAQIPQYNPLTTLIAPTTSVAVQNQNSAFLDNISSWAFQIADKTAQEAGEAQGVKDQQASGSAGSNVAPDGILGGIARITSYGKGYAKGADQIYATQKQMVLGDKVTELQKQFPADPDGFRKAYDTEKKTWLADVRPDLLPNFARHADEVGVRNVTQLQQQGVERQKQTQAVSALDSADKAHTEAYDGALSGKMPREDIEQKLGQVNALIKGAMDAGYITPMQARQQMERYSFNMKTADILRDFRNNPSLDFVNAIKNAKETMKFEGSTPLTPEQRQMIGNKLDSEFNQMQARARAGEAAATAQTRAQFNDHIAQTTMTGEGVLTDDQIKTAFGKNPVLMNEALAKSQIARDTYQFNSSIGLTSAAEDRDRLNKLMPQPGDVAYADKLAAFSRAQTMVANKWQAVESDPAQYVISSSPEIRSMITSDDPLQKSIGYATLREVQSNMGIAPGSQSILPNSSAKQIVHEIQSAGPEAAADKIAGIAATYGDNYPSVAKQFAKLGLNPAYQVLASLTRPDDAQTRVDLAKALAMGNDLKDNLDKRDKTIITSIDQKTQESLSDFTRTAMAQGDPRLVKTVNDAATYLAYYYASQPGTDATTAAKKAALALTSRYDFIGTMRVPKGTGAVAESATDLVRSTLTPDTLRPVPARPGEVLTDEQRIGIQLDQAKRGSWVTNEDGSGVVLLYPNGQPVMVRSSGANADPVPLPGDSAMPPGLDNKAIQKKTNTQGSEINTAKVEAAQQQVQDRRSNTEWKRLEVSFREMPALVGAFKAKQPAPTPHDGFKEGVPGFTGTAPKKDADPYEGYRQGVPGFGTTKPAEPKNKFSADDGDNQQDTLNSLTFGLLGKKSEKAPAPEQKFPGKDELDTARAVDQAYGSPHGRFFEPGTDIRKVDIENAPEVVNDERFNKVKWEKVDQGTADRLYIAAIASNKSAIASLGFDPRHFITSPPGEKKLSASGVFMTRKDTAWVDENYPSTFVHESVHRGLELLRKDGLVARKPDDETKDKPYISHSLEEMITRRIMTRNFGGVEKGRGDLGDKQVDHSTKMAKENPEFDKIIDQIEAMAAKRIKERQPRGPR